MAFYSYIRWELDEWAVVGLVILFILEALILWSLLNSVQRKRFERESERLALLATEGHRRLDGGCIQRPRYRLGEPARTRWESAT